MEVQHRRVVHLQVGSEEVVAAKLTGDVEEPWLKTLGGEQEADAQGQEEDKRREGPTGGRARIATTLPAALKATVTVLTSVTLVQTQSVGLFGVAQAARPQRALLLDEHMAGIVEDADHADVIGLVGGAVPEVLVGAVLVALHAALVTSQTILGRRRHSSQQSQDDGGGQCRLRE